MTSSNARPDALTAITRLSHDALVLDVGGWARPLPRADWVIDLGPYETRGFLGSWGEGERERFSRDTWVEWDICASRPWPFKDNQFDCVFCGHTLEDVRDPLRVCEEMNRVARAGYVESPSAALELCRGAESRYWVGHSHHRWLILRDGDGLAFVPKPHFIHHPFRFHIPTVKYLRPGIDTSIRFSWEGGFEFKEAFEISLEQQQRLIEEIVSSSMRKGPRARVLSALDFLTRRGKRLDRNEFPRYQGS